MLIYLRLGIQQVQHPLILLILRLHHVPDLVPRSQRFLVLGSLVLQNVSYHGHHDRLLQ